MSTIKELNKATLKDLWDLDEMLMLLARYEHSATGNTRRADIATNIINRIAKRYDLIEGAQA